LQNGARVVPTRSGGISPKDVAVLFYADASLDSYALRIEPIRAPLPRFSLE
jgi:hypothetical protein